MILFQTEDGEASVQFPSINLEQIEEAEKLSQCDTVKETDNSYLKQLEDLAKRNNTTSLDD